ncbi:hypothetical protein L0128_13400 [candidate division KSB1 bacterium]|nr:hypothetical protein [candidate division KSB1 bacterium]
MRFLCPEITALGTSKQLFIENLYDDSSGLKTRASGISNGVTVEVDQYSFWKYRTEISPDKKSLLILGDSVTMGMGVPADSTFVGLLSTYLSNTNVLNPSIIGYNIKDYCNLIHHFVSTRQNDFKISELFIFWCLNDDYTDVPSLEQPGGKLRYLFSDVLIWIRSHSRLYMFIKTWLFD